MLPQAVTGVLSQAATGVLCGAVYRLCNLLRTLSIRERVCAVLNFLLTEGDPEGVHRVMITN